MMATLDSQFRRIAVIAALAARAPSSFGRTALMKWLYFLQTVQNVPLGYNFSLYTYGPFESTVLSDLNVAERLGAVESQLVSYPGGYGYEIHPSDSAKALLGQANDFLSRYSGAIEWVIGEFGNRTATDLEMASTLVYVDRAASEKKISLSELTKRVRDIKPRLDASSIEREARQLRDKGIIKSAA